MLKQFTSIPICPYEKSFGYIYMWTNRFNGRRYIGKHTYRYPRVDVKYFASGGSRLEADLQKFGQSAFHRDILYWQEYKDDMTEEELRFALGNKEIEFISFLNENDYNEHIGGELPMNKRQYEKVSNWEDITFLNKEEKVNSFNLSETAKEKISKYRKEYYLTHDGYWKDKFLPEETRKLISETSQLRFSRAVTAFWDDMQKRYDWNTGAYSVVRKKENISKNWDGKLILNQCLNHTTEPIYGFIWRFSDELPDYKSKKELFDEYNKISRFNTPNSKTSLLAGNKNGLGNKGAAGQEKITDGIISLNLPANNVEIFLQCHKGWHRGQTKKIPYNLIRERKIEYIKNLISIKELNQLQDKHISILENNEDFKLRRSFDGLLATISKTNNLNWKTLDFIPADM